MRILTALIKKEFHQIIRDPSSIIIAFVLPFMLLFIYMYGVNLDTVKIKLGIVNDDPTPEVSTLVKSFSQNPYVDAYVYIDKSKMDNDLVRGKLNGEVLIPNDFSTNLSRGNPANLMIITDGSVVNTANYVQNYPQQIVSQWYGGSKFAYGNSKQNQSRENQNQTITFTPVKNQSWENQNQPIIFTPRTFYNQDLNSHYFILPGSLAITMSLIGILLTALVVAREWERGTMEAILSTQVRKIDIVLGKYIPYFLLGMYSMIFNTLMCIFVFKIPFRGNFLVLLFVGGLFLFTSLGFGLLISTKLKNQFLASQAALGIGFLPALLLSGLMFPINSMPEIFQHLTRILPPRYFVSFIESEFMAGTVWEIVLANSIFLSVLGTILFIAVYKNTQIRLEGEC